MPGSNNQYKRISRKWLTIGAGSLLLVMMLPSTFLLVKIAVGLIIVPVIAVAIGVTLKTMSKVLEDKQGDQNQATQRATQSRVIDLAVGLLSIFIGGLSLFTIAQIGLTAACTAVATLVLYRYFKDEEIGKVINDKLGEIAEDTTDFVVSNIEKLLPPQQSCRV